MEVRIMERSNYGGTVNVITLDELYPKINEHKEVYAYFRKFNALHGYFATHFNADEESEVEIDQETINELYEILNEVAHNPEKSRDLLPTYPGPFFGSYEYDRLYHSYVREARDAFYHAKFIDHKQFKLVYWSSY